MIDEALVRVTRGGLCPPNSQDIQEASHSPSSKSPLLAFQEASADKVFISPLVDGGHELPRFLQDSVILGSRSPSSQGGAEHPGGFRRRQEGGLQGTQRRPQGKSGPRAVLCHHLGPKVGILIFHPLLQAMNRTSLFSLPDLQIPGGPVGLWP